MILVTLGTQKFPMNRLVQAMDELAAELEEEVFIQTGNSTYIPKNAKHQAFVDSAIYAAMIQQCSLLITHSGVGSIMTGIRAAKPIIVVPRLLRYGEHVDDHQLQIAEAFEKKSCVLCCTEVEALKEYISKAGSFSFKPYTAPEGKIEDMILDYIAKT